jgi:putative ABC transport system permease protein
VTSPELLAVFNAEPKQGRFFDENDCLVQNSVVVVSEGFARRHFGDAASVIGRTLRVNGQAQTIIGVLTSAFPRGTEVWLPRRTGPFVSRPLIESGNSVLAPASSWVGRLRPGVTAQQAQAELTALAHVLDKQSSRYGMRAGTLLSVRPFLEAYARKPRQALTILLAGALFLLALGITNCSSVLVGTALLREREFAVRLALGASPKHLGSQLLKEASGLGLLSGLLSMITTKAASGLTASLVRLLIPDAGEVSISGPVSFALAFAIAVIAGSISGVAGAVLVKRSIGVLSLNERSEGFGNRLGYSVRKGLMVVQVAVAFTLTAGALTCLSAYHRMISRDPGFDSNGV